MARKASTGNDIKSLKAKAKWQATVTERSIQLRSGIKTGKGPATTFSIPGAVRVLETQSYVYLSVPAITGIFIKDDRNLMEIKEGWPLPADLFEQMAEAMKANKKAGKAVAKSAPTPPDELVKKISDTVPAGYKLAIKDGQIVYVKARKAKS